MNEFFQRYGFWFLQGIGLLLASAGVRSWIKFVRYAKFPEMVGKVELVEVVRVSGVGDTGQFVPRVLYSYVVDGESFRSDKFYSIGNFTFTRSRHAEKVLRPFRVGTSVSVRYDPEKPSSSFLINGAWGRIVTFLGFGLLAFSLGLWIQHGNSH